MTRRYPWTGAPWTPRDWQKVAVTRWQRTTGDESPVIRAVTGAGKSVVIAELAWLEPGRTIVTTPTVKLVDQLASTLRARGLRVGKYYTHRKDTTHDVIVCCNDSLGALAEKIDPPELWIVDEAHKSENDQIHDVVLGPKTSDGRDDSRAWVPARRVGFTATPYRADDSEKLSLFDVLLYDYGPAEAIKDGVVVWPRVRQYEGAAETIDDACIEMIRQADGPGLVDAINIADAREFTQTLKAAGIRAKAVHSKLHNGTIRRRLEQLHAGELDCVVHVSLLSEGVDLPWLRWLCCRRPITSKVLFAQYVGRGLRQSEAMEWNGQHLPAKKWCDVFDPNDLFGKLSLDYEAVLSGDIEDDAGDAFPELPALEVDWAIEELKDSTTEPETLRGVPIRVIDPTIAFIRRLHLTFQFMGLTTMKIGAKEWREEDPTDHQLRRISRDSWVLNEPDVPPHHRRALVVAIKAAGAFNRGTCSDIIAILNVLKFGWPAGTEEEVAA